MPPNGVRRNERARRPPKKIETNYVETFSSLSLVMGRAPAFISSPLARSVFGTFFPPLDDHCFAQLSTLFRVGVTYI